MSTPEPDPPVFYPIPRPASGTDPRFTIGLAIDTAKILTDHGYPPIISGPDIIRLQQALFHMIYQGHTP
jgi:hypothetical protein